MLSNLEEKETRRGVTCIHCEQPIPLSRTILQREKEYGKQGTNAHDEWHSRVFAHRCKLCGGESIYTLEHIHEIEEIEIVAAELVS
jgi:hypothetical protein